MLGKGHVERTLMRMRSGYPLGLVALAAGSALAQCLIDADGDAHPIFRSLSQRVDVEYIGEEWSFGWPIGMAFGDLDGDGDLDGAFVSAAKGEYLTVLLNRGDAVFDPPVVYGAGAEPVAVALGDLDADGDLDVVVVNAKDDTISVFLNDGQGALGPQAVHAVGDGPASVIAADLNADGLADLAVLNTKSKDVSILLATGNGALAPEFRVPVGVVTPKFPAGIHPGPFLTGADVDNDADLDLVVPSGNTLSILHNDGRGAFTLSHDSITTDIPEYINAAAAADFNADGLIDLAALGKDDPAGTMAVLAVILQAEGGSWSDPVVYSGQEEELGLWHRSIDAGDVDNDGDIDVVIGQYGDVGIGLFLNDGDATFEPSLHQTIIGPWLVALEDLDNDGWLDLAFVNGINSGRALRIHLNDGAGNLAAPSTSPDVNDLGQYCDTHHAAAAADLDLDGDLDVVGGLFGNSCLTQVNLYENDGAGTFGVAAEISLVPVAGGALVEDVEVAELNGDDWPDIVVVDRGPWDPEFSLPGAIWVLLHKTELVYTEPVKFQLETSPFRATLADFDGDGHIDAAVSTRGVAYGKPGPQPRAVEVFLNDGAGALSPWQTIVVEDTLAPNDGIRGVIASADLDMDGDIDVVTTVSSALETGRIVILENDGAATFSVIKDEPVGYLPSSILLDDLDKDSDIDMALIFNHAGTLEAADLEPYLKIYHNDGSADLTLVQEHLDVNLKTQWNMGAADFNSDGYPDLALTMDWGGVLLHLNNGDGTFAEGVGYDRLDHTVAQVVGDFDTDGREDIVAASIVSDAILTLLPNESCPPCPADINADGSLNILDFVSLQLAWIANDPAADCDDNARFNILDFVCFQQLFQAGCP
jgi:hypothetical protein